MGSYSYRAVDIAGERSGGVVKADSASAARALLRERGLFPLDVVDQVQTSGPESTKRRFPWRGVRDAELSLTTRQWATLLISGLTMEQALSALIDQAESVALRQVLIGVRGEILAGYALQSALDWYPQVFPSIYRASVAAGEKSGELANVMAQLADHLERSNALRRKTLQAMLYPAIVTGVALFVVVGLMTYVVPQVVAVFQQGKQALPLLTRALIATSDFLRRWGWLIAALVAAIIGALHLGLRREDLRRRWDARLLLLPVIGRQLRAIDATRFASTLAILVGSGVPLLAALEAGRRVMVRLPLCDAVAAAANQVREGVSLAGALGWTAEFPPLLVHMIASGEATGRLDELLQRAASLQQADVENRIAIMTTLMEPLLLLVMGGVVMLIVLAVMEPIIEINHLLH